jgi:hypothetical protein
VYILKSGCAKRYAFQNIGMKLFPRDYRTQKGWLVSSPQLKQTAEL